MGMPKAIPTNHTAFGIFEPPPLSRPHHITEVSQQTVTITNLEFCHAPIIVVAATGRRCESVRRSVYGVGTAFYAIEADRVQLPLSRASTGPRATTRPSCMK